MLAMSFFKWKECNKTLLRSFVVERGKVFVLCFHWLPLGNKSFLLCRTSDDKEVTAGGAVKRECTSSATARKASSSKAKKQKIDVSPDLLDATWIHPESYGVAER